MTHTLQTLADEIVAGRRLSQAEDLDFFIDCDLQALRAGADSIRARFMGARVDLCAIVNARSGRCPENCKYCAQSSWHKTNCDVYDFLPLEKLVESCRFHEAEGVDRFSVVTSGRALVGEEFERAVRAFEAMSRGGKIKLCASMGFLSLEQLQRLRRAGVTSYHHNIETAPSFFSQICTTHTIEQKLATFKLIREADMRICSGGIVGMGESWSQRIEMAATLAEHKVDSIPLNALIPIKGTPLEDLPRLTEPDLLRIVAIFRYLNPQANIRLAAGRALMSNDGMKAFESGADSAITGNMLTTVACATIRSDRAALQSLGRDVLPIVDVH